jgi:hypothetical protein
MLAYRSGLDSGSLWHIHIHTHIHILTASMGRPSTRGRHFTGTAGIAFLSRDTRVSTVFTMFIIDNELTWYLGNPLSWLDI